MIVTELELARWIGVFLWPFLRLGAAFAVAPVFSGRTVPVRVRVLLAAAVAAVVGPLGPPPPGIPLLSAEGFGLAVQEVAIGITMGFILQLVFAAMAFAGESVAMAMGLGFASMMDPQNGTQTTVVSSYYVIMATLLFLALNGHLMLVGLLSESFHILPPGGAGVGREAIWLVVTWAGHVFSGGLLVALPAVAAMLLVNLAFGVITRAAPQLNIFAVGFPITLLLGFLLLLFTVPTIAPRFESILDSGLDLIRTVTQA